MGLGPSYILPIPLLEGGGPPKAEPKNHRVWVVVVMNWWAKGLGIEGDLGLRREFL